MGCRHSVDATVPSRSTSADTNSNLRKSVTLARGQVKIKTGASSLRRTYRIGKQIGEGNFGKVFEATLTADSSCKVAIKVLDKKFMD